MASATPEAPAAECPSPPASSSSSCTKPRLDTHSRLIEHTERLEPKDYQSTTRGEYALPSTHTAWRGQPMVGPRERQRQAYVKAVAESLVKEEERTKAQQRRTGSYETTNKTAYSYTEGSFLEEARHVATLKAQHGKFKRLEEPGHNLENKIPKPRDYKSDTTITWYSAALKEEGGPNFNISAAPNASNPFARSSNFTNNIETEPYKHHEGSVDQPGILPSLSVTIKERQLLESCRAKILESVGGETEADIARAFASLDVNYDTRLSLHELVDGLGGLGVELMDDEIQMIIKMFDRNKDGFISPEEFFSTLKKVD